MPDTLDPRRWRRIALIVAIAAIIEFGLMVVSRLVPAMGGLMNPAYVVVAIIALLAIWQSYRRRPGSNRRQDERRDPDEATNDSGARSWD